MICAVLVHVLQTVDKFYIQQKFFHLFVCVSKSAMGKGLLYLHLLRVYMYDEGVYCMM